MRCQMCGAELAKNDRFCYECGFKLFSPNSEVTASESFEENLQDPVFQNSSSETFSSGPLENESMTNSEESSISEDPMLIYAAENLENKPIQSRFLEISSQNNSVADINAMDATFNEDVHGDAGENSDAHEMDNALYYDLEDDDPDFDDDKSPKRSMLLPLLLVLLGTLVVGSAALIVLSESGTDIPFIQLVSNQTENSTPLNTSYNDSKITKNNNTTSSSTTCSMCQGQGVITCPACNGQSFLSCSACGGDGIINGQTCTVCGGKGDVICSKCKCTGIITCPQCKGTGIIAK